MSHLVARADAGTDIGSGHVVRCLALAQGWRRRGGTAEIAGFLSDQALVDAVIAEGIAVTQLRQDSTIGDFREQLAAKPAAAAVVLDGYGFDAEYQRAVADGGVPVIAVDDLADLSAYHADAVVNHNIYARADDYPEPRPGVLLCGTRYAMLRSSFSASASHARAINPCVRRVLVTLGASDRANATSQVLRALLDTRSNDLEIAVVLGAGNPHQEAIEAIIADAAADPQNHHVFQLHVATRRMDQLMRRADMVIGAAGGTVWEAASAGLPMALLVTSENQRKVAPAVAAAGAAIDLGRPTDHACSELARRFEEIFADAAGRRKLSERARQLVDGRGTDRVAGVLLALSTLRRDHGLRLRRVDEGDEAALLALANQPEVRRQAFSPQTISAEEHREWFRSRLAARDTRMWVLDGSRQIAAQIRYEATDDGAAEIGFSVAERWRGRGLGTWLLRHTYARACEELRVTCARGIVLESNVASRRAFERAGFSERATRLHNSRACRIFERPFHWTDVDD
jgi:UDP-2,4-diacetamido-2,4,6-trideoxy-beta-L-altropyranose hydrolase